MCFKFKKINMMPNKSIKNQSALAKRLLEQLLVQANSLKVNPKDKGKVAAAKSRKMSETACKFAKDERMSTLNNVVGNRAGETMNIQN